MTTSTPNSTSKPARPTPHIDILFLGSPGVGKATFLSRLPSVVPPNIAKNENRNTPNPQPDSLEPPSRDRETLRSPSTTTLPPPPSADIPPPAYTLTPTPSSTPSSTPTNPPPLTGPQTFSVLLFARPYTITIHPSKTQLFIDAFPTDPPPRFAIIAFSVPDKVTLYNARHYWLPQLRTRYPDEEGMRILLLGLQRDLRTDRKIPRRDWTGNVGGRSSHGFVAGQTSNFASSKPTAIPRGAREISNLPVPMNINGGGGDGTEDWEYECVMPEEGLHAAREMGADRYAECSARTGELIWEVVEDITRMAAKTTVEDNRGSGGSCAVM